MWAIVGTYGRCSERYRLVKSILISELFAVSGFTEGPRAGVGGIDFESDDGLSHIRCYSLDLIKCPLYQLIKDHTITFERILFLS